MATDKDVFTTEKIIGQSEVNHPQHYNMGKIEVIDAIEEWCLGFNDGNAVKYIARHKFKNNPIGDLKKAIWYLNREVQKLTNAKAEMERRKDEVREASGLSDSKDSGS